MAALQQSRELSGFFQVIATAAPGHSSPSSTRRSRPRSRASPSRAHGGRAAGSLAQAEAQFVYRLQTVGGFGGKSDQLNAYNVFVGDPGFFDRDLQRYREATPEAMAAAARLPRRGPRVALSVVPRGRPTWRCPIPEVVCS